MNENDVNNYLLKDFERAYYFSLEQKERLETRLSIRLVILGLVLGGLTYISAQLPIENIGISVNIFYFIYSISIVSFLFLTLFLIAFLLEKEYGYIPFSHQIKNYIDSWRDYLKANSESESSEELINANLNQELIRVYLELLTDQYKYYADLNTKNNEIRSRYLVEFTNGLIICISSTTLLFLYFTIIKI